MSDIIDIIFALGTLTILEVILGIDNLVFLTITSQKLPKELQTSARRIGLTLAWGTRLILLALVFWLTKLVSPLFTLFNLPVSGRDLFLFCGGIFLLAKGTQEIFNEITPKKTQKSSNNKASPYMYWSVILQIALLDIIFSLDSVLTAIGLSDIFLVMAAAITIAIVVMIFLSEPLSNFIESRPSIRMLALSFLLLIGMVLIADAFHIQIPRGYIYFAMGFAIMVECLNLWRTNRINKCMEEL